MKKLSFIFLILLSISCSKNDPIDIKDEITTSPSPIDKIKKEYGIEIDDLELESLSEGVDPTKIYINGILDSKLWIGEFDAKTKKQTLEWLDKEKVESNVTIYNGYGEYATFKVNSRRMDYITRNGNAIAFQLSSIGKDNSASDLYVIEQNNTLLNKFRKPVYNILPWHEGFISEIGLDDAMVISSAGDSLFTFEELYLVKSTVFAINYEDFIMVKANINESELYFEKRNLRDKKLYFNHGKIDLTNIPKNSRIDEESFYLMDNTLTYNLHYTSYEGEKELFKLEIDIKSGEYKVI